MDLPLKMYRADDDAGLCPSCHAPDAARATHAVARASRSYRGAWFVLACFLAVGMLWANRYEYQVCDLDGCVRINRWTSRVDWVGSEVPYGSDAPQAVQASARRDRAAAHLAGHTVPTPRRTPPLASRARR